MSAAWECPGVARCRLPVSEPCDRARPQMSAAGSSTRNGEWACVCARQRDACVRLCGGKQKRCATSAREPLLRDDGLRSRALLCGASEPAERVRAKKAQRTEQRKEIR